MHPSISPHQQLNSLENISLSECKFKRRPAPNAIVFTFATIWSDGHTLQIRFDAAIQVHVSNVLPLIYPVGSESNSSTIIGFPLSPIAPIVYLICTYPSEIRKWTNRRLSVCNGLTNSVNVRERDSYWLIFEYCGLFTAVVAVEFINKSVHLNLSDSINLQYIDLSSIS